MKQKFTFQIRGNVLIENQAELEKQMREVLARFPNFVPTFSSVEIWTDFNGNAKKFNDDGTEYVPPVVPYEDNEKPELEDIVKG
mgnify:CR=1 FL=1